MKKKLLRWGGVIVAILIAFFVYQSVNDQLAFDRLDKGGDPQSARQYIAYTKDLEARYKNDNYGSTTPEGTLELFVEALKKEDVKTAANYFVPEKRKQTVEDIKTGLKSGGIKIMFEYMEKYPLRKEYIDYMNSYRFYWTDQDDVNVILSFIYNKYSGKWLVEEF